MSETTQPNLGELQKSFVEMKGTVEQLIEKQAKEIAQTGGRNAELAEQIATATKKMNDTAQSIVDFRALHDAQQKRLDELEVELKSRGTPMAAGGEGETPVSRFLKSDAIKAFRKSTTQQRTEAVAVGRFWPSRREILSPVSVKAGELLTTSATQLVAPARLPMVAPAERRLRMRDLIPAAGIDRGAVDYIVETGFFKVGATLAVTSLTSSSTTATLTATAAHGIPVGAFRRIRVSGANQTEYNGDYIAKATSTTAMTYTFAGSGTSPATGTILYQQMQTHGGAGAQTEGSAKNQAQITLTRKTANDSTVAHYLAATRQILNDDAMLESYVSNRLLYGLAYKEDSDILYGSGSSPDMQGILTHSDVQALLWSSLASGDSKIDALRKAMTRVEDAEYAATGIVINPWDWQDVELTKDGQKQYVMGPSIVVQGAGGQLFRVPVVVTNAIAAGTALVGAFQMATALWDVEQATLRVTDSHDDWFVKNQMCLLAEERVIQTIYRPEAFIEVTFDSAP